MARIGLVAHDDRKDELCRWAEQHREKLSQHELWGTGTTGSRIMAATGLSVTLLKSGPLGGDQQIGAMIATGEICDAKTIMLLQWAQLNRGVLTA